VTRQVNFNGYIQRLLPMLLILGVMVHEYGHLTALRLLGAEGVIHSTGLNLTWRTTELTGYTLTAFYLAGGFLQGVYGLYNMVHESDNETWLSGFTVMIQGWTYMWFEAARLFDLGAIISVAVAALSVIFLCVFEVILFD